ncbi:MAG TPA: hemolysin family protein [Ardenticatenaceae bacterium]|nr:hemolysin family protein [Ardenticatenaceae bacterium]
MAEFLIPTAIIVILVLINGLFVAAEFAIIGIRPTRIARLMEEGNRTAAHIKHILDDPSRQDRYIATAQLGIAIASLGLGMYGEHTVAEWLLGPLEHRLHLAEATAHTIAIIAAIALLTFAHVVIGEMVPKSLALQYAERTALGIAGIMSLMERAFYPAVLILNAFGNAILRLFGVPVSGTAGRLYSPEELELIVTESHEGGLLTANEQLLIQNIFDFSERRVGQVMTPRRRVEAIPLDISEQELRTRVVTSRHSRFPVYEGDLDHVVGLLLAKDFIRQQLHATRKFDLKTLLRHIPAVPQAMLVERLLPAMKRSHVHMALVIDEYGGTAGVVTLEDLVEEVVGEVRDEFDPGEPPALREIEPGVLLARGDLLLDDLREQTPVTLPDEDELPDVETVGGLVVGLLGRPATPGDRVDLDGTAFTVEAIDGLAVAQVRITLPAGDYPPLPGSDQPSPDPPS